MSQARGFVTDSTYEAQSPNHEDTTPPQDSYYIAHHKHLKIP